jgi:hypothetical protein
MTVNWTLAFFAYQWAEGKTVRNYSSSYSISFNFFPFHSKDIREPQLLMRLSQSLREGVRGEAITIKTETGDNSLVVIK